CCRMACCTDCRTSRMDSISPRMATTCWRETWWERAPRCSESSEGRNGNGNSPCGILSKRAKTYPCQRPLNLWRAMASHRRDAQLSGPPPDRPPREDDDAGPDESRDQIAKPSAECDAEEAEQPIRQRRSNDPKDDVHENAGARFHEDLG